MLPMPSLLYCDLFQEKKASTGGRYNEKAYKRLEKDLHHFLHFYDSWTKHNSLAEPEHPWSAFRDKQTENTST